MKIAIPKERREHEARVAASPDTVKKLLGLSLDSVEVVVESGAGDGAAMTNDAFKAAGASIAKDYAETVKDADVVLKVRRPITSDEGGKTDELAGLKKGCKLIALMDPWQATEGIGALAGAGVDAFSMEFMPRITRAQAMDVLSSQANLAGYRAVIDAAAQFRRAFPMMMTAAGTVPPAKALIMGAGVAGLQAIATARRLGAVVSATDVRPAAKEQVESLGASFVAVEDEEFKEAEAAGGYAKEMSEAYRKKQAELIAETITKMDLVVTTALIPGKPAPKLVTADMVKSMKPGSILVDLAVTQGGNVELSEPDKVVEHGGVTIIGHTNWPSRIAVSASQMYARNLLNFLQLMVDKENKTLTVDMEDEIMKATCLTREGKVVHPNLEGVSASTPSKGGSGSAKAANAGAAVRKSSAGKTPESKTSGAKTSAGKATGTKSTKSSGAKTSRSKTGGDTGGSDAGGQGNGS
ncbi:Re/Si-specific NAD(P)(+) transhydrogenase subunit alpha [Ferruginivarius sediminum]|uniref:NAD(P) transhydrogenase subunit alpha n=1 Tax=Ferruginivarius sediminum TaxID=2661937 RepID=A0A369T8Z1_9PROT|nr:Re/Si-specific NAD(P)(+) transhydrogenase subunit alpha [Ferruginivarius sediminum]RDD61760.1 Re/Si-specific NAD(P)(+) transhydrogenase subunit alpha [Ferruginivarius sediminum]